MSSFDLGENNPLNYLLDERRSSSIEPNWATVTGTSPLRIRLDGSTAAVASTPLTLVNGLATGDRVLVGFYGESRAKQMIILGRGGGQEDTGWLHVSAAEGFTSSGEVRQIGPVLYFRGGIQGTLATNVTTSIGTSPLGPQERSTTSGATSGGGKVNYMSIAPSGLIALRNDSAITSTFQLFGLSGAVRL